MFANVHNHRWGGVGVALLTFVPTLIAAGQVQEMIQAAWRSSGRNQGQESQEDITRRWLAPLDAVVVLPQVATADFGRYPFSEPLVKRTVESALRRRGMTIIDATKPYDLFKTAALRVLILGQIHSGGKVASVCILMKLQQEVALIAAETPTFARADTWQRAAFLIGSPRDLRDRYPKELQGLAGQFADDWLACHPDETTHQGGVLRDPVWGLYALNDPNFGWDASHDDGRHRCNCCGWLRKDAAMTTQ